MGRYCNSVTHCLKGCFCFLWSLEKIWKEWCHFGYCTCVKPWNDSTYTVQDCLHCLFHPQCVLYCIYSIYKWILTTRSKTSITVCGVLCCRPLDLLTLRNLTPCCNATFLPRFSLWSQKQHPVEALSFKNISPTLVPTTRVIDHWGKVSLDVPVPSSWVRSALSVSKIPVQCSVKTSFSLSSCYEDLLSWCQCSSALPPTLRLSPFHCGRGLKLQSPEQLETSCSSSLSREGKDTHTCTHDTHSRAHAHAVLCRPLYWHALGKSSLCHCANYLPFFSSFTLSPSHTRDAFSRKVLTSNLSLLPLLSLPASPRATILFPFVSISLLPLSSASQRNVTTLSFTRRLAFVPPANFQSLPGYQHNNYPFQSNQLHLSLPS